MEKLELCSGDNKIFPIAIVENGMEMPKTNKQIKNIHECRVNHQFHFWYISQIIESGSSIFMFITALFMIETGKNIKCPIYENIWF